MAPGRQKQQKHNLQPPPSLRKLAFLSPGGPSRPVRVELMLNKQRINNNQVPGPRPGATSKRVFLSWENRFEVAVRHPVRENTKRVWGAEWATANRVGGRHAFVPAGRRRAPPPSVSVEVPRGSSHQLKNKVNRAQTPRPLQSCVTSFQMRRKKLKNTVGTDPEKPDLAPQVAEGNLATPHIGRRSDTTAALAGRSPPCGPSR